MPVIEDLPLITQHRLVTEPVLLFRVIKDC